MVLNPCTSSFGALYLVYICTKFHENIFDGYRADTTFKGKFLEGHYSVKNVGGVTVLVFSAHRLMVVYICTNFMKKFSTVLKLLSDMIFRAKISKEHNSVKNVGGVMFFSLNIV